MRQLPLAISPPLQAGFDHLVVGPNAHAVQHLRHLAMPAAPVYLWGPSGCGKTYLLQSLVSQRQGMGERIGWFEAGQSPLPWLLDDAWTLVVVDDCQALDAGQQQAAFVLFVEAGSRGVQWAAAGRLPPVDLPIRDDLRTRLGWGHVFALQPLSESDTRSALRREADHRGILLSDDVMDFVLTRFQRDLKHLMRLLDRLDEFALAERRHVTVPLLRKMISEEDRPA